MKIGMKKASIKVYKHVYIWKPCKMLVFMLYLYFPLLDQL